MAAKRRHQKTKGWHEATPSMRCGLLPCSGALRRAGRLRTAFQCEDPVLFLEHKHLLRQPYTEDPYPPPDWRLPFGKGAVRRSGSDLTVVSWGATVQKSIEAAGALDGASGFILSVNMSKAMNRSFTNVLFGAFGQEQAPGAGGKEAKPVKSASAEDAAKAAETAAEAQRAWAATPHVQRAAVLRQAARLWSEYADEIRWWNVREVGADHGVAVTGERGRDLLRLLAVGAVMDGDAVARVGERVRDRRADPTRGAGDEHRAPTSPRVRIGVHAAEMPR